LILFVGNIDSYSFTQAQLINNTVVPIFSKDISTIISIPIGFISIGDHSLNDFITVLEFATEIHYITSDCWDSDDAKLKTETWLRYLSHKKPVHNLPASVALPMIDLIDQRKSTIPQIWAAGCSFTDGDGVEKNERWAQLVSDHLQMPISFLSHCGASNIWAADQILRSDINKNDIVVWGLTGISRVSYFNNNNIDFLVNSASTDGAISSRYLASDHLFYSTLLSINQVIKKSKDIGFQLVIIMFPFFIKEQEDILFQYLSQYNFFILGYNQTDNLNFIDIGNDNSHPGPKHNRYWADIITKHIDNLLK
jgi:hypothetical protein